MTHIITAELLYPGARYRAEDMPCACGDVACTFDALITFLIPDRWEAAVIRRGACSAETPALERLALAEVEAYVEFEFEAGTMPEEPTLPPPSRFEWRPGDFTVEPEA